MMKLRHLHLFTTQIRTHTLTGGVGQVDVSVKLKLSFATLIYSTF